MRKAARFELKKVILELTKGKISGWNVESD